MKFPISIPAFGEYNAVDQPEVTFKPTEIYFEGNFDKNQVLLTKVQVGNMLCWHVPMRKLEKCPTCGRGDSGYSHEELMKGLDPIPIRAGIEGTMNVEWWEPFRPGYRVQLSFRNMTNHKIEFLAVIAGLRLQMP